MARNPNKLRSSLKQISSPLVVVIRYATIFNFLSLMRAQKYPITTPVVIPGQFFLLTYFILMR
jgi:cytochrome P450